MAPAPAAFTRQKVYHRLPSPEDASAAGMGGHGTSSCAQGSCKKSIPLVRLALFYVVVLGFGPNLAAFGPKLDLTFDMTPWSETKICVQFGPDILEILFETNAGLNRNAVGIRQVPGHSSPDYIFFWGQYPLSARASRTRMNGGARNAVENNASEDSR
jgi:hypothetical protein